MKFAYSYIDFNSVRLYLEWKGQGRLRKISFIPQAVEYRSCASDSLLLELLSDSSRPEWSDLPDWSMLTEFQQTVLRCLRECVPAGKVITYSALASLAGRPGAARAVGGVMRANPFPVLIPCHRVVNADMSLGGFSGGLDVKTRLLAHEGIILCNGRILSGFA
eukprot:TRINITY_DN12798_c0_g2_i1.p2 TRINITY_DN12798_c0_g2~~TRINITY_DN12798_c0_g2_i1.p2  ORF type:complete len:163 (+),score=24.16 TRINITY_DN12798_c0_g2_i1:183-671(+)